MDCVLHIGIGKAGSSTIQAALQAARAELATKGILYPDDLLSGGRRGGDNQKCLAVSCMESTSNIVLQQHGVTSATARRAFNINVRQLYRSQIAQSDASICILSAEHFWSCLTTPVEIARLATTVGSIGLNVQRIIIYLRRQSDWLESIQQQRLREAKELLSLSDDTAAIDAIKSNLNYADLIAKWQHGFPDAVVCPRIFHRSAFKDGNLLADFIEATGVAMTLTPQPDKNVSALSNAGINAMIHMNRAVPLVLPHGKLNTMRSGLVEFISSRMSGACTIVPEEQKNQFDAAFAASNAAVCQEFFPERQPVLFPESRKADSAEQFSLIEDAVFLSMVRMVTELWSAAKTAETRLTQLTASVAREKAEAAAPAEAAMAALAQDRDRARHELLQMKAVAEETAKSAEARLSELHAAVREKAEAATAAETAITALALDRDRVQQELLQMSAIAAEAAKSAETRLSELQAAVREKAMVATTVPLESAMADLVQERDRTRHELLQMKAVAEAAAKSAEARLTDLQATIREKAEATTAAEAAIAGLAQERDHARHELLQMSALAEEAAKSAEARLTHLQAATREKDEATTAAEAAIAAVAQERDRARHELLQMKTVAEEATKSAEALLSDLQAAVREKAEAKEDLRHAEQRHEQVQSDLSLQIRLQAMHRNDAEDLRRQLRESEERRQSVEAILRTLTPRLAQELRAGEGAVTASRPALMGGEGLQLNLSPKPRKK